jgi:carbamoyl-phosphate synthase large subunit
LNILFTSIGRRVELVHAFKRAFQSLQLKGKIIATDMDSLAPALRVVDDPYIVPPLHSPDYIATVVDICKKESVDFIFPLIDPDVSVLANHRKVLEETGARALVISPEAAKITTDKCLTEKFFAGLELSVPKSWLPSQIDASQFHYPVFIKPRAGSASKNAFHAHNRKELEFFLEYIPDPIVQEYLPGPEITSDVICDPDGNLLAVVSRRRIEVRFGEVAKGVTILDARIIDACVKIARQLGAIGPITVQCMMKENHPYFTEINARFGGGLPLGIEAGVDSPKWLLARLAGIPIEIPPLGTYRTGLYMTRYDESFFITESEREHIPRRHI